MIIYTGTKVEFSNDVMDNLIADKIQDGFKNKGLGNKGLSEFRSWEQSLRCMQMVLGSSKIDDECRVAIEYQIPMTSKRVDFIITGKDNSDNDQVVIVELKGWEKAEKSNYEDVVHTYLGKAIRLVTHPSYQAYSYARIISDYNESVEEDNINITPCAFLHNYKEEYRDELDNNQYNTAIELAPIFLRNDFSKLRLFIEKFINKADNGEILYKIDNGRIRPSKMLQDTIASMMNGNKEFSMIDEQKVAFEKIKKLVDHANTLNKKSTIIIEGGPGTGKTVIAINLLAEFRHLNVNYITKNSAPRNVFFDKLRKNNFKLNYISNLFKGSGSYINVPENTFDCLIVDEAHRLNEKSGMFQNKGENQIKEIIQASKVSVFFIDEDQIVTTKDIGSINQIAYWADVCGSELHYEEDYKLVSQFRCNGSNGYISFLDNMLGIRETANYDGFDLEYDLRFYDDLNKMKNDLKVKNKINNRSRMLAGYCYNWVTKNSPYGEVYDIEIGDFKAKWNFSNTKIWAIDESSFDQVGCIHTSQGLEFDYVGVIIGKDLIYDNGEVVTDLSKRAKTDTSLRSYKKLGGVKLADRIIRNTYRTLMTRGQKGCYIYCEDKELMEYMKKQIKN